MGHNARMNWIDTEGQKPPEGKVVWMFWSNTGDVTSGTWDGKSWLIYSSHDVLDNAPSHWASAA